MDLSSEKLHIIDWVIRQDKPGSLNKIVALIEQMENETIDGKRVVGYRKGGVVVTGKELAQSLAAGIADYRNGQFRALDEVETESEQW